MGDMSFPKMDDQTIDDGIDIRLQKGDAEDSYHPYLAARALSQRNYALAAQHYERAQTSDASLRYLRLYTLCMADNRAEATRLATEWQNQILSDTNQRFYWQWLADTFRLNIPVP